MKGSTKPFIYSMWMSIIITVFSSFLTNSHITGDFPDIRYTSEPVLGVSYWGYPLGWLKQVVIPDAHKVLVWQNFLIDIIIWGLIAFVIFRIFLHTGIER